MLWGKMNQEKRKIWRRKSTGVAGGWINKCGWYSRAGVGWREVRGKDKKGGAWKYGGGGGGSGVLEWGGGGEGGLT